MYVEVDGWRLGIHFASCHMVPGHPKCGRFHGHVYSIKLKIHGEKQEDGMIVDFHILKKIMKEVVDRLDHRILLPIPESSTRMNVKEVGESIYVSFDGKNYQFPKVDCALIPINVPTAEELAILVAKWFAEELKMLKNIEMIEVAVEEGRGQGAWNSIKIK